MVQQTTPRARWLVIAALLCATACQRCSNARKVAPAVMKKIGITCPTADDCGTPLTCAAGSNFAHTNAGFTCQLACDQRDDDTCPVGWGCSRIADGPGSSLPGVCTPNI